MHPQQALRAALPASAAGLSRGQIQKLQQDAGKWMGMAALLCESAGWWPLATLYANLSQVDDQAWF